MKKELAQKYDPKDFEERLYKNWVDKGYFSPKVDKSKKPFTIVMPPPNITGILHMGHAFDHTIQDVLIRYKRMQGYNALWLPGTDHAAIATEVKVENMLLKDGIEKRKLGREKFLEKVWEWREQYGGNIVEQCKKLGDSCDWNRERFTMDEGLSDAVLEVFVRLYNKGLIYRGARIINWCPKCKTALSDAEVEYMEDNGHLWHIRYNVVGSDEYITVATTRPETMIGDTAVAVHPDDERYKNIVGKMVMLPLVNKEIPVIADEYVDKEFGTGVVKITPAHDPNDFEVGQRHNLEVIRVMNDDGTMNELAGKYQGMDRYEARKVMVEDLDKSGNLVKVEDYMHNVGHHDRCGTVGETIVSKQWFVKMEELAKPAIDVVNEGKVKLIPERFNKIYMHWMENIRDWCISRQLWWGHRIPAYYCDKCNEMVVAKQMPEVCPSCGHTHFHQDEDCLDTWFSSALWPFSTLGWPNNTEDLEYFFPTDVLVTGGEILFFWVARMIFSSLEQMNEIPFKYVYIHGIVRDSQGRKMSKSLGNGIDPLDVIDKHGTDALRFMLLTGNSLSSDMRFYWERVEAARNFANKLWNASRFVLMNLGDSKAQKIDVTKLEDADKWILSKLNTLIKEVNANMEGFELGIAAQKIYDFTWEYFCDWYIEMTKSRLWSQEEADVENKENAKQVLVYVLKNILKLLHPFMPFITEEIYQTIIDGFDENEKETIVLASWPEPNAEYDFAEAGENMEMIMEAIKAIRLIRAEMNVVPSKRANIIAVVDSAKVKDAVANGSSYFEKLAWANSLSVKLESEVSNDEKASFESAVSVVVPHVQIYMPMGDLIDYQKEIERLEKEKKKLIDEVERVNKKLSNQGFVSKAPKNVIEEEEAKREKYQDMLNKVDERLKLFTKDI